ncbi:nucleoside/nucleotide kinase family protein [Paragemmobacter straminiformis]|uniref:Nucleoside/nucleotide kinase family protein n=1 Tax=Paragemmobacter straminiformis TaxID=2045119 RepID=A0A842IBB2_9RHOB|nr:nucleoside/nucleotide kinase family protein [Gemmobacter straminiformis]MBC2836278.1 nucleoside/nucleotide kinase family protein [Gemmobacter straminiformis]
MDYIDVAGLADLLAAKAGQGRVVAAIAGPPGSGKSTVAERIADALNARAAGMAAVLPMDGYHYDDLHLVPAGLRPRKGAPDTFDVGGLYHTLGRIRARDEDFVAVPVFDRDIEIARAGARMIAADIPVIVVEGNYLLLGQDPWSRLRPMFDVAVLVEVPEAVLRERLRARWLHYKLTPEEIDWKLDGNDLPNGRMVMAQSTGEDFRLKN